MAETRERIRKAASTELTREDIALRAYEIAHGEHAGTPEENWLRAERELSSNAKPRSRKKKE